MRSLPLESGIYSKKPKIYVFFFCNSRRTNKPEIARIKSEWAPNIEYTTSEPADNRRDGGKEKGRRPVTWKSPEMEVNLYISNIELLHAPSKMYRKIKIFCKFWNNVVGSGTV